MYQERQRCENEEDDEEDLRPFPGETCHAPETEEGGDQSDDEKQDCQA